MATMHQLRAVGYEGGCSHSPASQPQALHISSWRRTRHQRLQTFHAAKDGSQAAGAAGAAAGSAAVPAAAAAAAVEYDDNWSDAAFIALCRIAYGRIAGYQSSRSWIDGPETFRGMVEVSRALVRGRSAEEQRAAVIAGFPQIQPWFRRLFPYSRWGAEVNARITPMFFTWLVGPAEVASAEVDGQTQQSAVKIQRCRYLAESGCTAMCVNLCKSPVQQFFTEQLGMPLTMTPDFETYSCEMVFGKVPPPLAMDPAASQPCLAACTTAVAGGGRCHKLD